MPVMLQGNEIPLTAAQVEQLWQATRQLRQYPDAIVAVRCVTASDIQRLNAQYRGKNAPTNVLTFSYSRDASWPPSPTLEDAAKPQHDVALCLEVARAEAKARGSHVPEYIALVLTHGFLHATGLDHEQSAAAETATRTNEAEILRTCGFTPAVL